LGTKKWLGTGTLAHHRQQEANTPRNEIEKTKMSDEIGIEGRIFDRNGGEVALEVWM